MQALDPRRVGGGHPEVQDQLLDLAVRLGMERLALVLGQGAGRARHLRARSLPRCAPMPPRARTATSGPRQAQPRGGLDGTAGVGSAALRERADDGAGGGVGRLEGARRHAAPCQRPSMRTGSRARGPTGAARSGSRPDATAGLEGTGAPARNIVGLLHPRRSGRIGRAGQSALAARSAQLVSQPRTGRARTRHGHRSGPGRSSTGRWRVRHEALLRVRR